MSKMAEMKGSKRSNKVIKLTQIKMIEINDERRASTDIDPLSADDVKSQTSMFDVEKARRTWRVGKAMA